MYSYQERWRKGPAKSQQPASIGKVLNPAVYSAKIRESLYGINKRLSLIFENGAFFYLNEL